jgi:formate hydrogenlyase subunit 3/multisubunit Na+/H+ antiporter MnhD subunit
MNILLPGESIFALVIACCAVVVSLVRLLTPAFRRVLGLLAPSSMLLFFASCIRTEHPETTVVLVPGWLELQQVAAYCGVLFNFVYTVVFIAFGERVFSTRSAGYWLAIQLLVSLGLLCENIELFALVVAAALVLHVKVSQEDVYQVSRKQDRFIVVVFSSLLAVVFGTVFFGCVASVQGLTSFKELIAAGENLPRYLKVLSSLFMMTLLGAFPFHFWVKPLFGSPGRYGLAVITRLNIGFIVWCKIYPLICSGDPLLDTLLTYGCGANLLYAAFLLFGERRLSQIVSSLYLFHVPLLILAVRTSGVGGIPDFILDFANITVAISALLVILGMLRDRLGAEELERASGLGISYPFFGISFLVCVLSLVGFPGTLGFVSSEVMLHHFAESTWPVAACFVVTLALNGYSSFRIFGESFYGDPAKSFRRVFQPLVREKVAIVMVLLFLLATGIGQQVVQAAR